VRVRAGPRVVGAGAAEEMEQPCQQERRAAAAPGAGTAVRPQLRTPGMAAVAAAATGGKKIEEGLARGPR
jgi:hypothetical protein